MCEPSRIEVTMISDLACPWCYVGLKRLLQAVESLSSQICVAIRFWPYMIDLGTAKGGELYLDYNKRRWGGDGWTRSLRKVGAECGCYFASWKWWPNSENAHRLLEYAAEVEESGCSTTDGLSVRLKLLLFEAVYERGLNISDNTFGVLQQVAKQAGLPEPTKGFEHFLFSGALRDTVIERDSQAKQQGVRSVPTFLIRSVNPHAKRKACNLQGCVSVSELKQAFQELAAT